jgi:hypothetical protein
MMSCGTKEDAMNRRRLLRNSAGLALAAAALTACRTTPIQSEVPGEFIGRASMAQRADQIRRAGAGLGWVMESRGPGLMRGVLNIRDHQALVDIPYDNQRFSIRYAGSSNLNYDGTSIHPNYNSWVQNLQRAIMAQPAA